MLDWEIAISTTKEIEVIEFVVKIIKDLSIFKA